MVSEMSNGEEHATFVHAVAFAAASFSAGEKEGAGYRWMIPPPITSSPS
jgi:hypothetical protein